MSKVKKSNTTSTELYYDLLADPTKLIQSKQFTQIISIDTDDENESYIIDISKNDKNDQILSDRSISNKSEKSVKSVKSVKSEKSVKSVKSVKSEKSEKSEKSNKLINDELILSDSFINNNNFEEKHNIPIINEDTIYIQQINNEKKHNIPKIINNEINIPKIMVDEKPKLINNETNIPKINNNKEIKFKKMEFLAKLMHIKNSGLELSKHYNMDSDLEDMENEVKYHSDIQTKKNGIQLAKSFMCNAITGLEFLNDKYDPFGFKLKGWSEQVKVNKEDFDDVFSDLIEKYKSNSKKLEPELKLFIMLAMSAGTFHMTQNMMSSLPGLDDVIKNNPNLMSKLQSNLNKTISGPTELDKKKELYENVKKLHEEKIKTKVGKIEKKSVIDLLNNIKNSIPDSITDNNSITIGETICSDSDIKISKDIKTKSRILKNKK